MGKERPELTGPPDFFYNEDEARKYTNNSRMIEIQSKLASRAVELLSLPDDGMPKMLLDVGCGSGLSGEQLTELVSSSRAEVRERQEEKERNGCELDVV